MCNDDNWLQNDNLDMSWELCDRQIENKDNDADTVFLCSSPPNLHNPKKYSKFWVNVTQNEYYGLLDGERILIPRNEWLLN